MKKEIYLPFGIFFALILGTTLLCQETIKHDAAQIRAMTRSHAATIANQITSGLDYRFLAIRRMQSRREFRGYIAQDEWENEAANDYNDMPGFRVISWVDSRFFVRYIYPLEGNESITNFNLYTGKERITAIDQAMRTHEPTLTHIFEIRQGGPGFGIFAPIFRNNRFEGIVGAGFHAKSLLEKIITSEGFDIRISSDGQPIYTTGTSSDEFRRHWGISIPFQYHELNWTVETTPTLETLHHRSSSLPWVILLSGLLLSTLVGIIGWLFLVSLKAEAQAWSALEWRRAIMDSAQHMLIATDTHGKIITFNAAAERNLGYRPEEVIGIHNPMLFHDPLEVKALAEEASGQLGEEIPPDFSALIAKAKRGIIEERECAYVRKDGSLFPISITVTPLRGTQNEITGYLGVAIDITEKIQARIALEQAREAAIRIARAKSAFLANMSHEIRTPLNGIIGITDLLIETSLNEEQKKYAKTIQSSGSGLLMIINDILDYSKIEAGKMTIELIDFSPVSTVENEINLLANRAKEKGLSLTTLIDPSVPSRIQGDPGRIGQVLLNLIGNAIKFTQSGSIITRLGLERSASGQTMVKCSVQDTGIGIPDELRKILFQPFTQGDETNARKFGGTGLGLSICKRLVELMDGEIGFESQKGEGSTFWFTFPLLPSRSATEGPLVPLTPPSSLTPDPNIRVLVAEDNDVNQMLTVAMLKKLGYSANAVTNGLEVLESIAKGRYDLILMDCQMPEMDGYEATAAIRKIEQQTKRHIPIIALTANSMKEDEEKCLRSGMDAYLSKPVKKEKLSEILHQWTAPRPASRAHYVSDK